MLRDAFSSVWDIPKLRRRVIWLAVLLFGVFYFFLLDPAKNLYYHTFYGEPSSDTSYESYLNEPFQEELEQKAVYNISKKGMEISMKTIAVYKFYGMVADRYIHGVDPERKSNAAGGKKEDRTLEITPFHYLMAYGPFTDPTFLKKYGFKVTDEGFKDPRGKGDVAYLNATKLTSLNPLRFLAKNYIIPANNSIYKMLKALQPYDRVYMEGYLVEYEAKEIDEQGKEGESFSRTSSLSRDDGSGPEGEEIFYVEKIVINGYEYK